ncbi:MAG: tetratricopeptide repeat protein [Thermodesulfobacteriota bacterium]
MEQTSSPCRNRSAYLSFLLLLSGFCGISYEVLYGRLLSDLIGSQFIVNAAILLTFLLGIGWGTLFAHRLWRLLPLLEAGIGLYALFVALLLPGIDRLLYTLLPGGLGWGLAACVVLLFIPAFCIGTSLPLFTGYMSRLAAGSVFSWTYAVYNFGAAMVVLFIEFVLIRWGGIRSATLLVAALNLVVGLALHLSFDDIRRQPPTAEIRPWRLPRPQAFALVAASIASAVFQLLAIKLAECLFGPFRETFALVLALVFVGIALGSWLVRRWRIAFTPLLLGNLGGIALLLAVFGGAAGFYASLYPLAVGERLTLLVLKMALLATTLGLPFLTFGATLAALATTEKNAARESGRLLFLSSMANGAGFLLMVFFLHQRFDYGVLLCLIAGFSTLAVFFDQGWQGRRAAAALLLFVMVLGCHRLWDEDLLYLGHTAFLSREELQEQRGKLVLPEKFKGPQDIFSIVTDDGSPRFFINGYVSMALDSPWEPLVGAIAATTAPRLDKALVLGVGSGNTASVVGMLFDHTDGVEINGAVLANLHRMKEFNLDIEANPRVRLIQDDAIHFVKAGESAYSLIVNTVTTPLYFSSAKLYTRDFLDAVKRRLAPGGVYVTWVDSRVGEEGIDIMLRTLDRSFPHCALAWVRSSYFLLLASDEEIKVHQPLAVAEHPVLADRFRRAFGIEPARIAYQFLAADVAGLVGRENGAINTLDYPALEFAMSRLGKRGFRGFVGRLLDELSLDELAKMHEPASEFSPFSLLLHAEELLGDTAITHRLGELVAGADPRLQEDYQRFVIADGWRRADLIRTADGYHRLGFGLMKRGLYAEALPAYTRSLQLDPGRNNTRFNMGACYEYLGRFGEALRYYRQELQIDADDRDVPFRLGRVQVKMGRFVEAREELEKAVRLAPTPATYFYLGQARERLEDAAAARDAYRKGLALDPDDDHIKEALALLAVNDGDAGGM